MSVLQGCPSYKVSVIKREPTVFMVLTPDLVRAKEADMLIQNGFGETFLLLF